MDNELDKLLDAAQTLKIFEADLVKANEALKEMTRDRDSALAGLKGAQKQAKDQTRLLLEAEDQLRIAKEQIANMKEKGNRGRES